MLLEQFSYELDAIFQLDEKRVVSSKIQPWGKAKDKSDEDVERLYNVARGYAEKAKGDLNRLLKRSATANAKILIDIKSLDSFADKIVNRGHDAEKIVDVLRSAVLVASPEEVDKVTKAIEKKSAVYKIDKKSKGGDETYGYYGSVHMQLKVKGIIVEVQVMTKKLWAMKNWGHEIYNKWRSKDRDTPEFEKDKRLSKIIFSKGNLNSKHHY
jgi:hypothetical protein